MQILIHIRVIDCHIGINYIITHTLWKTWGEFNGSRTFNMFSFCEIIPNLIWYCVLFYDFPLCGFWYCYQRGLDFLNYNQHQRSPDIRIPNCKFKTMGPHTLIKESKYLLIRYKILLPSMVKLLGNIKLKSKLSCWIPGDQIFASSPLLPP